MDGIPITGMDITNEKVVGAFVYFRGDSKHPVVFRGPFDRVAYRPIPKAKAGSFHGEPATALTFPKVELCVFEVIDVCVRANPHAYRPVRPAHRLCATKMPAVNAVRTAKAMFDFEGSTGFEGLLPAIHLFIEVIGVDELSPTETQHLVQREARVGDPLLIQIVGFAIRRRCKYLLWQCVCQTPKTRNTLRGGKFSLLAIRHVDSHAVHEARLACLPRTGFASRGDDRMHTAVRPNTSKLSFESGVMSQAFLQS